MQPTTYDETFDRLAHRIFDTAVIGAVGQRNFLVYLALRRHVWRTGLGKGDCLISRVGQDELAVELGLSSRSIRRALQDLDSFKWISVLQDRKYKSFVLGTRLDLYKYDRDAEWLDFFFTDAICAKIHTLIEHETRKRNLYYPSGEPAILKLPGEVRAQIAKDQLKKAYESSKSPLNYAITTHNDGAPKLHVVG